MPIPDSLDMFSPEPVITFPENQVDMNGNPIMPQFSFATLKSRANGLASGTPLENAMAVNGLRTQKSAISPTGDVPTTNSSTQLKYETIFIVSLLIMAIGIIIWIL